MKLETVNASPLHMTNIYFLYGNGRPAGRPYDWFFLRHLKTMSFIPFSLKPKNMTARKPAKVYVQGIEATLEEFFPMQASAQ
jgi:hypothetical protein